MQKPNKGGIRSAGLGVGYVSVMIIFAIICLTIFAVLSYRAASSNDAFNERSGIYLKQYYDADSAAKERLARLDTCACEAVESGFFEDTFEMLVGDIEGVSLRQMRNGFTVDYSIEINERQCLSVSVLFKNDGKYEILNWQSRTESVEDDDSHLNVWDGSF